MAPVYGDRLIDGLFLYIDGGRPARHEHVAWTLVRLADDHPSLIRPWWATLVEVLQDDNHQVQYSAAAALAAAAATASDLAEAMAGLLNHDDRFVRRYACLALGDVAAVTGDETTLRALANARADDAPSPASGRRRSSRPRYGPTPTRLPPSPWTSSKP